MTPLSVVLSIGLTVFWGISLQNVLQNRKTTAGDRSETPISRDFILALFGSLLMFAETLAFIALDFAGKIEAELGVLQGLGLALFFIGSVLHAWSVQVRGRYAVSWPMPEDQKLVTDPPYSFVRHPSYLAYMLMIIGVTLVW